jgi:hypothetical protein
MSEIAEKSAGWRLLRTAALIAIVVPAAVVVGCARQEPPPPAPAVSEAPPPPPPPEPAPAPTRGPVIGERG